jgi:hypothetical protein
MTSGREGSQATGTQWNDYSHPKQPNPDRGYADKYRAEGLPIHLIGVEFSREQRNVVGFAVESL